MPDSDVAPALDDETTAALTLFNEYVEADRERNQREKRVKKAERIKDEAAATLKKLNDGGSAEARAEAEAAYKTAADRWKKLKSGEEPDDEASADAAAPAEEAPAEEAPAEEAAAEAPAEEAAAEAPAEEAAAEEAAAEEAAAEEPAPEAPAAEEAPAGDDAAEDEAGADEATDEEE